MEWIWETILSERVVLSLLILALASFIQATVGFAAALFGIPLLMWAGNDLIAAQVMIITAMLSQNLLSVWKLRHSIDYGEVVWPALIRVTALPIGIAGLAMVMTWSAAGINQLVGLIILLAVVMQAFVGIEWKTARRPHWLIITFGGSGVLQGLSGMSGPPMVLWVHGQRYSTDRARAFLFAMYITNFFPQMLLLWWQFGSSVLSAVIVACLSLPAVLVGAMLGLRLGSRLGDRWLRPITYACLIALAVRSLLQPLWAG
ncbi:MAG: sulfite exporter TauE/SafE family protein [Pirellulaceae bacterium]